MSKTMIHARIEEGLKAEVEKVFRELGLSTTEAITTFFHQVKLRKGLPFPVMIPETRTVTVKRKTYTVVLHPDLEEGGYWVECPALPGCASQGDTMEEALEMIQDAIEGHLEVEAEKDKVRKAA